MFSHHIAQSIFFPRVFAKFATSLNFIQTQLFKDLKIRPAHDDEKLQNPTVWIYCSIAKLFHMRVWMLQTSLFSSLCLNACFVKQQSSLVPSQVVQGLLAVFYNLGDGDYNLTLPHQHLSDGEWHEVELDRYGREFTLRLDGGGGRREVTASHSQGQEIIVDPTVVMLGNSFPSGHNRSFLGRYQPT